MVKADIALHIPDNLSFEEAATTGRHNLDNGALLRTYHSSRPKLAVILMKVTLEYQKFGIPPPSKPSGNQGQIFVYGESSAIGTMIIQFTKLCIKFTLKGYSVSSYRSFSC
jgi:NADPH:quinone reductase-like Zn-dependent oxidoreductase